MAEKDADIEIAFIYAKGTAVQIEATKKWVAAAPGKKEVFERTKAKVEVLKKYPEFCAEYPRDLAREDKWEDKLTSLYEQRIGLY